MSENHFERNGRWTKLNEWLEDVELLLEQSKLTQAFVKKGKKGK